MIKFAKHTIQRLRSATLAFLNSWNENTNVVPVTEQVPSVRNALDAKGVGAIFDLIEKTLTAKRELERASNSLVEQELRIIHDFMDRVIEKTLGKTMLDLYVMDRKKIPYLLTEAHTRWDTEKMEKRTHLKVFIKDKVIGEAEIILSKWNETPNGETGYRIALKEKTTP